MSPFEVLFGEIASTGDPVSRPEWSMKGDSMKSRAKQSNDQNDPMPACNSVLALSDNEQLSTGSELQNQETTSASLIDNWIDA